MLEGKSQLTLAFLKRGKFYLYSGDKLSLEKLEDFALNSYEKSQEQGLIPATPTVFQALWE